MTEVPIPLSAKQRYMWREIAGNPGVPCRNLLAHYAIDGPLDLDRLQAALCLVVGHHEQLRLRTTGPVDAPTGTLRDPPATLPLSVVDLSGLDEPTAGNLVAMYCERQAATYLDIGSQWAVRTLVLSRSPDRHLLLLTIHHLTTDGWGAGLVSHHLEHAYRTGGLAGIPVSMPYTDYVKAEVAAHDGRQRAADLRWWQESLRTVRSAPLFGSAPRPGLTMDTIEFDEAMPASFRSDLRRIAGPVKASNFAAALALLAAALWHRTRVGQRVLFVSHMGPRIPGYEHTVGVFSNRLPLVTRVEPDQAVADVVRTVQAGMLDLLEHASTPFFELLESVPDPRVLNAQFSVQHVPPAMAGPCASDATFRFQRYQISASFQSVQLLLMEEPDGRMGWHCEFRSDIFRCAEGMSLIRELLADMVTLAGDETRPMVEVLGR
jgi:hypothetical protein